MRLPGLGFDATRTTGSDSLRWTTRRRRARGDTANSNAKYGSGTRYGFRAAFVDGELDFMVNVIPHSFDLARRKDVLGQS
jgi:hypothetical protein